MSRQKIMGCAALRMVRLIATYSLILNRVASFVVIPTPRIGSWAGTENYVALVQQQLPPSRLDTSILLSMNSNDISSTSTESAKRSNEQRRMGELTKSEQIAYDILCELSKSQYSFRIVVVGKNGGAILESTVPSFGPKIKILQSPSTGTTLKICSYVFALVAWYFCVSSLCY